MENEVKEKKKQVNYKLLISVLVVLVIVVVGLAVTIVLISRRDATPGDNNSQAENQSGSIDSGENSQDIESQIDEIKQEMYDLDADDAEAFIDKMIDESQSDEMTNEMILSKIYILNEQGRSDEALRLVEDLINKKDIKPRQLMSAYIVCADIHDRIGNEDEAAKYRSLYVDAYLKETNGGSGE